MDLTDLVLWKGHLSGIQRVVLNLAESYSGMGARYFAYHFGRGQLFEVSFDPADYHPPHQRGAPWSSSSARSLALRFATRPHRPRTSWVHNQLGRGGGSPAAFQDGDRILLLGNVWDQPGLQPAIERAKVRRALKVFHLIHDLVPVVAPHLCEPSLPGRYAEYLIKAAALSHELLANSQATARDLARFAAANDVALPPVTVIRLGDELVAGGVSAPDERLRGRSFVLTVGSLEARKNHALLCSVWRLAQERGIELPTLAIVGGRGFGATDTLYALANDPALRDRVLILSDVDDGGLRWLYQNCRFTIYPSVYEGWGLPIAESLRYRKLCLVSRSSSMPEIAGDLVEYFSPFDAGECLALTAKYLDDDRLRDVEAVIAAGYSGQSWSQTARELDARLRDPCRREQDGRGLSAELDSGR